MPPICLSMPSLVYIFAFHLKNRNKNDASGKRRRGENQIGNVESLFMSRFRGRGVAWCRAGHTFGCDVNICDNINYIPRKRHATLPLSFFLCPPPSFLCRLHKSDMKGEWYFTVTEERERHSNMLMIWWWARQKMKVWVQGREQEREGNHSEWLNMQWGLYTSA